MNCKDCCQDCQRIGCDIEVNCTGYVKKPMTNADRIRSMTDEELTIFLAETSRCSDWCNLYEKCKTKTDRSYSVCLETWNDWLKEESESE